MKIIYKSKKKQNQKITITTIIVIHFAYDEKTNEIKEEEAFNCDKCPNVYYHYHGNKKEIEAKSKKNLQNNNDNNREIIFVILIENAVGYTKKYFIEQILQNNGKYKKILLLI